MTVNCLALAESTPPSTTTSSRLLLLDLPRPALDAGLSRHRHLNAVACHRAVPRSALCLSRRLAPASRCQFCRCQLLCQRSAANADASAANADADADADADASASASACQCQSRCQSRCQSQCRVRCGMCLRLFGVCQRSAANPNADASAANFADAVADGRWLADAKGG